MAMALGLLGTMGVATMMLDDRGSSLPGDEGIGLQQLVGCLLGLTAVCPVIGTLTVSRT